MSEPTEWDFLSDEMQARIIGYEQEIDQLKARIAELENNLREWHMAWITDCIAPKPNGNVCNGTDEGVYLSCKLMTDILEKTRQLFEEEA